MGNLVSRTWTEQNQRLTGTAANSFLGKSPLSDAFYPVPSFTLATKDVECPLVLRSRKRSKMTLDEMKPGDVRVFRGGQAVVLAAGIWAKRAGKKWIRIDITGTKNLHTTVTNDPSSDRYHRTLFRDLRRILLARGCWSFGAEGEETEGAQESRRRKP